jgi:co-chaperonin GroES (HSP10)
MNTTIATPNKKIVSLSGAPIKTKNTSTKEGIKLTEEEAIAKAAAQLPDVKGYRILCMVPQADATYESGLVKADSVKQIQEHSTVVLFVMQLGDLCYKDEARFPTGAWCAEGDFVITRAYAGTRIKIHGKEFRIINDDTVEAVVDDPRGYERA